MFSLSVSDMDPFSKEDVDVQSLSLHEKIMFKDKLYGDLAACPYLRVINLWYDLHCFSCFI